MRPGRDIDLDATYSQRAGWAAAGLQAVGVYARMDAKRRGRAAHAADGRGGMEARADLQVRGSDARLDG